MRKPKARELRGLQVQSLVQGDVNAVMALVPRISMPTLVSQEVEDLSIEDLGVISGVVLGFFMSKADIAMMARVMGQDQTSTS
ncbi:phage tail assembly protein [Erythrobacter sp. W302b]|uniref:phage tail assembly protein n=1 Tax=Erythrobacter sp. W302b TaxID=3389874 RepID=UPI00396AF23A